MANTNYFEYFEKVTINDVELTNIFKQIKIKSLGKVSDDNDILKALYISDKQKPEDIALTVYKSRKLWWIIFLINGIKDYFYDWPLNDSELKTLAVKQVDNAETGFYEFETGESTIDDIYNRVHNEMTIENDNKRYIAYLNPKYLSDFLSLMPDIPES